MLNLKILPYENGCFNLHIQSVVIAPVFSHLWPYIYTCALQHLSEIKQTGYKVYLKV